MAYKKICALCGKTAFKPVFVEMYRSNGFVWLLNNYICKDKCERNLADFENN